MSDNTESHSFKLFPTLKYTATSDKAHNELAAWGADGTGKIFRPPSARFFFHNGILVYQDQEVTVAFPKKYQYVDLKKSTATAGEEYSITLCDDAKLPVTQQTFKEVTNIEDLLKQAEQSDVPLTNSLQKLEKRTNFNPLKAIESQLPADVLRENANGTKALQIKQWLDDAATPGQAAIYLEDQPEKVVALLPQDKIRFRVSEDSIAIVYTPPEYPSVEQTISLHLKDIFQDESHLNYLESVLDSHPVYLLISNKSHKISESLSDISDGKERTFTRIYDYDKAKALLAQVGLIDSEQNTSESTSVIEGEYALELGITNELLGVQSAGNSSSKVYKTTVLTGVAESIKIERNIGAPHKTIALIGHNIGYVTVTGKDLVVPYDSAVINRSTDLLQAIAKQYFIYSHQITDPSTPVPDGNYGLISIVDNGNVNWSEGKAPTQPIKVGSYSLAKSALFSLPIVLVPENQVVQMPWMSSEHMKKDAGTVVKEPENPVAPTAVSDSGATGSAGAKAKEQLEPSTQVKGSGGGAHPESGSKTNEPERTAGDTGQLPQVKTSPPVIPTPQGRSNDEDNSPQGRSLIGTGSQSETSGNNAKVAESIIGQTAQSEQPTEGMRQPKKTSISHDTTTHKIRREATGHDGDGTTRNQQHPVDNMPTDTGSRKFESPEDLNKSLCGFINNSSSELNSNPEIAERFKELPPLGVLTPGSIIPAPKINGNEPHLYTASIKSPTKDEILLSYHRYYFKNGQLVCDTEGSSYYIVIPKEYHFLRSSPETTSQHGVGILCDQEGNSLPVQSLYVVAKGDPDANMVPYKTHFPLVHDISQITNAHWRAAPGIEKLDTSHTAGEHFKRPEVKIVDREQIAVIERLADDKTIGKLNDHAAVFISTPSDPAHPYKLSINGEVSPVKGLGLTPQNVMTTKVLVTSDRDLKLYNIPSKHHGTPLVNTEAEAATFFSAIDDIIRSGSTTIKPIAANVVFTPKDAAGNYKLLIIGRAGMLTVPELLKRNIYFSTKLSGLVIKDKNDPNGEVLLAFLDPLEGTYDLRYRMPIAKSTQCHDDEYVLTLGDKIISANFGSLYVPKVSNEHSSKTVNSEPVVHGGGDGHTHDTKVPLNAHGPTKPSTTTPNLTHAAPAQETTLPTHLTTPESSSFDAYKASFVSPVDQNGTKPLNELEIIQRLKESPVLGVLTPGAMYDIPKLSQEDPDIYVADFQQPSITKPFISPDRYYFAGDQLICDTEGASYHIVIPKEYHYLKQSQHFRNGHYLGEFCDISGKPLSTELLHIVRKGASPTAMESYTQVFPKVKNPTQLIAVEWKAREPGVLLDPHAVDGRKYANHTVSIVAEGQTAVLKRASNETIGRLNDQAATFTIEEHDGVSTYKLHLNGIEKQLNIENPLPPYEHSLASNLSLVISNGTLKIFSAEKHFPNDLIVDSTEKAILFKNALEDILLHGRAKLAPPMVAKVSFDIKGILDYQNANFDLEIVHHGKMLYELLFENKELYFSTQLLGLVTKDSNVSQAANGHAEERLLAFLSLYSLDHGKNLKGLPEVKSSPCHPGAFALTLDDTTLLGMNLSQSHISSTEQCIPHENTGDSQDRTHTGHEGGSNTAGLPHAGENTPTFDSDNNRYVPGYTAPPTFGDVGPSGGKVQPINANYASGDNILSDEDLCNLISKDTAKANNNPKIVEHLKTWTDTGVLAPGIALNIPKLSLKDPDIYTASIQEHSGGKTFIPPYRYYFKNDLLLCDTDGAAYYIVIPKEYHYLKQSPQHLRNHHYFGEFCDKWGNPLSTKSLHVIKKGDPSGTLVSYEELLPSAEKIPQLISVEWKSLGQKEPAFPTISGVVSQNPAVEIIAEGEIATLKGLVGGETIGKLNDHAATFAVVSHDSVNPYKLFLNGQEFDIECSTPPSNKLRKALLLAVSDGILKIYSDSNKHIPHAAVIDTEAGAELLSAAVNYVLQFGSTKLPNMTALVALEQRADSPQDFDLRFLHNGKPIVKSFCGGRELHFSTKYLGLVSRDPSSPTEEKLVAFLNLPPAPEDKIVSGLPGVKSAPCNAELLVLTIGDRVLSANFSKSYIPEDNGHKEEQDTSATGPIALHTHHVHYNNAAGSNADQYFSSANTFGGSGLERDSRRPGTAEQVAHTSQETAITEQTNNVFASMKLGLGKIISANHVPGKTLYAAQGSLLHKNDNHVSVKTVSLPVPTYISTHKGILLTQNNQNFSLELAPHHRYLIVQNFNDVYELFPCNASGTPLRGENFEYGKQFCGDNEGCSLFKDGKQSNYDYRNSTDYPKKVNIGTNYLSFEHKVLKESELRDLFKELYYTSIKNGKQPILKLLNPGHFSLVPHLKPADETHVYSGPVGITKPSIMFAVHDNQKAFEVIVTSKDGDSHSTQVDITSGRLLGSLQEARKTALDREPLYLITDGETVLFSTDPHGMKAVNTLSPYIKTVLDTAFGMAKPLQPSQLYEGNFYVFRVVPIAKYEHGMQGMGIQMHDQIIEIPLTPTQRNGHIWGFAESDPCKIEHRLQDGHKIVQHYEMPKLQREVLKEFISNNIKLVLENSDDHLSPTMAVHVGQHTAIKYDGTVHDIAQANESQEVKNFAQEFLQELHNQYIIRSRHENASGQLPITQLDVIQLTQDFAPSRDMKSFMTLHSSPVGDEDNSDYDHLYIDAQSSWTTLHRFPRSVFYFRDDNKLAVTTPDQPEVVFDDKYRFFKVTQGKNADKVSLALCDQEGNEASRAPLLDSRNVLFDVSLGENNPLDLFRASSGKVIFELRQGVKEMVYSPTRVELLPTHESPFSGTHGNTALAHLNTVGMYLDWDTNEGKISLQYMNPLALVGTNPRLEIDLLANSWIQAPKIAMEAASKATPLYLTISDGKTAFTTYENAKDSDMRQDESFLEFLKTILVLPEDGRKTTLLLTLDAPLKETSTKIPFLITPLNGDVSLIDPEYKSTTPRLFLELGGFSVAYDSNNVIQCVSRPTQWAKQIVGAILPVAFVLEAPDDDAGKPAKLTNKFNHLSINAGELGETIANDLKFYSMPIDLAVNGNETHNIGEYAYEKLTAATDETKTHASRRDLSTNHDHTPEPQNDGTPEQAPVKPKAHVQHPQYPGNKPAAGDALNHLPAPGDDRSFNFEEWSLTSKLHNLHVDRPEAPDRDYELWVRATRSEMHTFYENVDIKYRSDGFSYHEAMNLYEGIVVESCGRYTFPVQLGTVDNDGNVKIGNHEYGQLADLDKMFTPQG